MPALPGRHGGTLPARRAARLVWRDRLALVATEGMAPHVLAAVMPVVVAAVAAPTTAGRLGWGATAMLFSAVIPFGIILYAKARGRVTDHHVSRREQRRGVLVWGVLSVAAGLVLFALLSAPRPLTAMMAVMLATLTAVTVVNQWWKLSAHAAVAAGSATVLTVLFGPVAIACWMALPWVAWSRIHLRAHTPAQVLLGTIAGTLIALGIYLPIA